MHFSTFPSTTCWSVCLLFSIVYSCLLVRAWLAIVVGLFLESVAAPHLGVCSCVSATVFSRREEKGPTEDEMAGWHHRLHEHESEQSLGDGGGRGSVACCGPWGRKESDTTELLSSNNGDTYCFAASSSAALSEAWGHYASCLVLSLRMAVVILGLLWFHIKFRIACSSSVKNAMADLIGITLNL